MAIEKVELMRNGVNCSWEVTASMKEKEAEEGKQQKSENGKKQSRHEIKKSQWFS